MKKGLHGDIGETLKLHGCLDCVTQIEAACCVQRVDLLHRERGVSIVMVLDMLSITSSRIYKNRGCMPTIDSLTSRYATRKKSACLS